MPILKKALVTILFSLVIPSVGCALTVNVDFSRDNSGPLGGAADVLHTGVGPAPDAGTVWNNFSISMTGAGSTVPAGVKLSNLVNSSGDGTSIDIELTNGFYRAYNDGSGDALQRDRVFISSVATMTIQGLNDALTYDIYLIAGNFDTNFTIGGSTQNADGLSPSSGSYTAGEDYVLFSGVSPTLGEIVVGVQGPVVGEITGLQIHEVNLTYPDTVTTTGGQFSADFAIGNVRNNGFTSPLNTIDVTTDYIASGNNYATASGTVTGFTITSSFDDAITTDGMYVWNYVYRNGGTGSTSPNSGVNSYQLTFYDGLNGSGNQIGSVFSGNLAKSVWNTQNMAETVWFGTTYAGVRSVAMQVLSNHGAANFSGLNELAFNSNSTISFTTPTISSFTSPVAVVQKPAEATLSWVVEGVITSLDIQPDVGDVLALTTNGVGSIPASPIGNTIYTITVNGNLSEEVTVIGLPEREKVHLYLLAGQSNMVGFGRTRDPVLDQPDRKVLQFGSRDRMESQWVLADHGLTSLSGGAAKTGMGIEFGKAMLASQSDPDVVIGLINHALGATAIQWWAPGVIDNQHNNPQTGQGYYLYDEAIQRVAAASSYGVIKGVLWHQGEYNSNNRTNPSSEPTLYAGRLHSLVSNFRASLGKNNLPFVCGKLVPLSWVKDNGQTYNFTGWPQRAPVEAALADLPNHRSNTFCVDNAGLRGIAGEEGHFDSASQRELGQRYAAAMTSFYANPFLLYLGGFYTPDELAVSQIVDPDGDNDGDGVSNFFEYVFLTNPSSAEASAPYSTSVMNIPSVGYFPAFSYRRRTDTEAPEYSIELSQDLVIWSKNSSGQSDVTVELSPAVDNGDGTETVTVRGTTPIDGINRRWFFRLRAN